MIHTLLNLTRPLIVVDCESTGLSQDARIVELAFQRFRPDVGMDKEWRSLINPCMPIPEAAVAIHGITDVMLNSCQTCKALRGACACPQFHAVPTFAQIGHSLAAGFSECDFAGKNPRYDLRCLAYEFKLARIPWSYAGAKVLDADRLEALALPRDLGSLHEKYVGMKHDGAHGALSDVRATAKVLVKQLEAHASLPRSIDELHELSWPGWLTSGGEFRLVNNVPTCTFGKHRDKPVKSIPRDYFDWILSQDFAEDVKALARRAKMGEF